MTANTPENLKEKFLKVYSNLPLSAREETILVEDNSERNIKEPISWQIVFLEVRNNTLRGQNFLNQLNQLGLI